MYIFSVAIGAVWQNFNYYTPFIFWNLYDKFEVVYALCLIQNNHQMVQFNILSLPMTSASSILEVGKYADT